MDYSRIKRELLIGLRGDRSSNELSRCLGYRFNQVRRWELGEKQLRWDEFCDYCAALGAPLAPTARLICTTVPSGTTDDEITLHFLRFLRARFPSLTLPELSLRLHCHPSALKRYLKGETFPDVELVFSFLSLKKDWLPIFVMDLLPAAVAGPMKELFGAEALQVESKLRSPLSAAIEGCLCLDTYQRMAAHDDGFVASKVGCTLDEVREILEEMMEVGTVRRDGNGKFHRTYQTINTEGQDLKLVSRALRFWSERGALRFTDDQIISRGDVRSGIQFRVAPASKKAMNRIQEILTRAHDEILALLEEDEDPLEEVRVILLHSFNANDVPKAPVKPSKKRANRPTAPASKTKRG